MYEQGQSPVIGLGVEGDAVPWRHRRLWGIFVGTLDLVFVPFPSDKQTNGSDSDEEEESGGSARVLYGHMPRVAGRPS